AEFCMRAQKELDDLYRANRSAIVVGGTGLYIRALFEEYGDLKPAPDAELRSHLTERLRTEGLDALVAELLSREPQSKETVDLKNPVRVTRALERTLDRRPSIKVALPPFRRMKLGLSADISVLNERIEARTRSMVQNGWVQEVKRLLDEGYGPGDPGFEAIGYTELARYLEGRTDLEGAVATTIAETRRYAKRQRTWLRSEPNLTDLDSNDPDMVSVAVGLIESL
ncbi:MAG TPA: tRNA dimethylallyltransferase, partial [Fimbriimonas sp.]|nr:tRNA dimethylallyltransferase [Fimbriimonas sp.]